jgi:two-component system, OmpR family, response regulator
MNKTKIFLVDDDEIFLKSLEIEFLTQGDFEIFSFTSGESCLINLSIGPDIVILDYHLDGINPLAINGLQTLDRIKEINANLPVIILSSQDKIDVAVNCMHHQAFDYVVKSETAFLRLRKAIDMVFRLNKVEGELNWYMSRM